MEFHEKLQELRRSKGMTQEELAEALYVSRTAVSRWESGRGYPGIDSLKALASYFSVTVDDLLSADKLIFIAETENKSNMKSICELLFGVTDLLSVLLILLPLYPKTVDGYVYSVNLWLYTETAAYNRAAYWSLFSVLVMCGVWNVLQTWLRAEKGWKSVTAISVSVSIITILYLVLAREAYAATVAILLMLIKGLLIFRSGRTQNK